MQKIGVILLAAVSAIGCGESGGPLSAVSSPTPVVMAQQDGGGRITAASVTSPGPDFRLSGSGASIGLASECRLEIDYRGYKAKQPFANYVFTIAQAKGQYARTVERVSHG